MSSELAGLTRKVTGAPLGCSRSRRLVPARPVDRKVRAPTHQVTDEVELDTGLVM